MFIATQWAASQLGHHAALGSSWITLLGSPIYAPWKLLDWWLRLDAYAPGVFARAGTIAVVGVIASCGITLGGAAWRANRSKATATYGSARWADTSDIREAQLLNDRGVILGLQEGSYLRHDGPGHVLCIAPTRSGKGVGVVIPTLLTWTGSAIIHDVKGENWNFDCRLAQPFLALLALRPCKSALRPLQSASRGSQGANGGAGCTKHCRHPRRPGGRA